MSICVVLNIKIVKKDSVGLLFLQRHVFVAVFETYSEPSSKLNSRKSNWMDSVAGQVIIQ